MQLFLLQAEMSISDMLINYALPIGLMLVLVYFMMLRPQQKRDKQTNEMRKSLDIGDEIITRGGIIGRVVNMREDTLVIETGTDRSKVRIARWAVEVNSSAVERAEAAKAAKDKAARQSRGK